MTEKELYDLAIEIGRHNKILWDRYTDFDPDLRIALHGLIETFMFFRFGVGK